MPLAPQSRNLIYSDRTPIQPKPTSLFPLDPFDAHAPAPPPPHPPTNHPPSPPPRPILLATLFLFLRPHPAPLVLTLPQPTRSSLRDMFGRLHPDGVRLFFLGRRGHHWQLPQMPASGGAVQPFPTPLPNAKIL